MSRGRYGRGPFRPVPHPPAPVPPGAAPGRRPFRPVPHPPAPVPPGAAPAGARSTRRGNSWRPFRPAPHQAGARSARRGNSWRPFRPVPHPPAPVPPGADRAAPASPAHIAAVAHFAGPVPPFSSIRGAPRHGVGESQRLFTKSYGLDGRAESSWRLSAIIAEDLHNGWISPPKTRRPACPGVLFLGIRCRRTRWRPFRPVR